MVLHMIWQRVYCFLTHLAPDIVSLYFKIHLIKYSILSFFHILVTKLKRLAVPTPQVVALATLL